MTDSPKHGPAIEDASAWILRVGVFLSVSVMLTGIIFSFVHHHVPVDRMRTATFEYHPKSIWQGIRAGRGQAIIEVGIYLLLLTPIMRVFTSMVLFAIERDWLYSAVTLLVLLLTLAGLLLLK